MRSTRRRWLEGILATGAAAWGQGTVLWAGDAPVLSRRPVSKLKSGEDFDLFNAVYKAWIGLPPGDPLSRESHRKIHADYCSDHGHSGFDVHNSWHFLPWHRFFVLFHERALITVAIENKVENAERFRLPYWDWDVAPVIPELYGTSSAPVYMDRKMDALLWLSTRPEDLGSLLAPTTFAGPGGLGGDVDKKGVASASAPHSGMHMRVSKVMADMETAAADPLFYIHHANIDRFAEIWSRSRNVTVFGESQELLDKCYTLPARAPGGTMSYRVRDMIQTEALGYDYASYECGVTVESGAQDVGSNNVDDGYVTLSDADIRAFAVASAKADTGASSKGVIYLKCDSDPILHDPAGYSLFLESRDQAENLFIGTVSPFASSMSTSVQLGVVLAVDPQDLVRFRNGFRIRYVARGDSGGATGYIAASKIRMQLSVLSATGRSNQQ